MKYCNNCDNQCERNFPLCNECYENTEEYKTQLYIDNSEQLVSDLLEALKKEAYKNKSTDSETLEAISEAEKYLTIESTQFQDHFDTRRSAA